MFSDTIFALSSGRLPAGLAVIRISGSATFDVVATLSGRLPSPRQMALRSIRTRSGDLLDRGMVVFFPAPRSFTGEDCAELHLHGGRAVVAAVTRELSSFPGLRPANAGEFSMRAFRNGKFDLATAEALADLIDAETEMQRRFAIENSGGRNAALYARWRATLVDCRAYIEAELDFPEEEDVPGSVSDRVWHSIDALVQEIDSHLMLYRQSEMIRDGFRVAIIGAPNAGKSSLLNALAQRDAAIVSDEPGTTRDLVEVALDLNGFKIILTDTAGIRENAGVVEREGIARARTAAQKADLVLLMEDCTCAEQTTGFQFSGSVLQIRSKVDLVQQSDSRETEHSPLGVSVLTGQGISTLIDRIAKSAASEVGATPDPLPFRDRHVAELKAASASLRAFMGMGEAPLELAAEHLRIASNSLGRIVGAIDVEDLLDVVFSRFCIGK